MPVSELNDQWLDLPDSPGYWWRILLHATKEHWHVDIVEVFIETDIRGISNFAYETMGASGDNPVDRYKAKWLKATKPEMPFEVKLLQATPNL